VEETEVGETAESFEKVGKETDVLTETTVSKIESPEREVAWIGVVYPYF
jgi:hypothetical protein